VINGKNILKVLRDYGLTDAEAEVYIFLAKIGVQKARDISSSLKMNKAQSYRIAKDLEKRGMVEQTLESPSRFTAIPFEKLLDVIVRGKRDEANLLEDEKDDLLSYWRSMIVDRTSSSSTERVMVL
jgi:sugar-specific transcriptional regulator TrmB